MTDLGQQNNVDGKVRDIALITPGNMPLPPSRCTSIEIYMYNLAKRLAKKNQVRLYTKGKSSGIKVSLGINIVKIHSEGNNYLEHVINDLLQNPPSIIQIDNRPHYVTTIKNKLNIPIVLSLHSTTFILPKRIQPDLLEKSLNAADAVVVNSNYLKNVIEERFPGYKEKVNVIYPGVDLRKFPFRGSKKGKRIRMEMRGQLLETDKTILLFVGRFLPRKGIEIILEAFAGVFMEFPNTELWIIGGIPSKEDKSFHKLVRVLSQGLPVRFFSYIPHRYLYKYYLSSDLLICPSQLSESFGMVNIEAASCGIPAIGSEDWGIKESILKNVNGWHVEEYKDYKAWTNALYNLLKNSAQLETMGNSARSWVEENFEWARVANEFEKLYQKLKFSNSKLQNRANL